MQRFIWLGMAAQAFITSLLLSTGSIKVTVLQQALAGIMFVIPVLGYELGRKLRRKTFQGITQLNIFSTASEERNGIMYQPAPTCPMIDALKADMPDKYHVGMENIREHVKNIREWGQQWKNKALESEW